MRLRQWSVPQVINVSSATEDPDYLCPQSESMSSDDTDECVSLQRRPVKECYFLVGEASLCRLAPFTAQSGNFRV